MLYSCGPSNNWDWNRYSRALLINSYKTRMYKYEPYQWREIRKRKQSVEWDSWVGSRESLRTRIADYINPITPGQSLVTRPSQLAQWIEISTSHQSERMSPVRRLSGSPLPKPYKRDSNRYTSRHHTSKHRQPLPEIFIVTLLPDSRIL